MNQLLSTKDYNRTTSAVVDGKYKENSITETQLQRLLNVAELYLYSTWWCIMVGCLKSPFAVYCDADM